MAGRELAPATLLAQVQRVWPATVGEAIAAEAQPTAERGGVVTISCSASVWAQELDLMAPKIIARLNERLGGRPSAAPSLGRGRVRFLTLLAARFLRVLQENR